MANVQVRLSEDLEAKVNALATRIHGSRSDAIRRALAQGIQTLRENEAIQSYLDGDCSLAGAALEAGLPLHEMAARMAARGIPYARYSPDELVEDLATLRG